jgi:pimeloyl-ACP methyl ester carboxylesterase
MRPDLKVMRLDERRDLAWIEVGDRSGTPVFAFHGCPGRSVEFAVYDQAARNSKVRLIALDRPGYGHSSYQRRRRLSDFPVTVAQLADHLDLDRFAVVGHSQGGPHALACARHLPHRVSICGVVSGLAPPGQPGMTEGMLLSNRAQWGIYSSWPPRLDPLAAALGWMVAPLFAVMLRSGRRHPEAGLDRFSRMLPACDTEVMARPEIRSQLVEQAAEFSSSTARTSIQDMALGIREWGFSIAEIDIPVHVWHGDLDRNVPLAHGRLLAKTIPNATLHECPGQGHWLVVDRMEEVLRVLASSSSGGRSRQVASSLQEISRPRRVGRLGRGA